MEKFNEAISLEYLKKYIDYCYDEETETFSLDRNNDQVTAVGMINFEHHPHIDYHICETEEEAYDFAVDKIDTYFMYRRHETDDKSGTLTPSWFTSKKQVNDILEYFFTAKSMQSERENLNAWAKRFDYDEGHFEILMPVNFVTGYGTIYGADYHQAIPCHGVKIIAAHTAYSASKVGSFVFYDMYPYFTESDKEAVQAAKNAFQAKKNARKAKKN